MCAVSAPSSVGSASRDAVREFLKSSGDMIGDQPPGPMGIIPRGTVPIKMLCNLDLALSPESKNKIEAHQLLIRIALRPDKSIFESHLKSFGASLSSMTPKQVQWYEEQVQKWNKNDEMSLAILRNPDAELSKLMHELGVTAEDLSKPIINPAQIAEEKHISPEVFERMDKLGLFKLKIPREYGGLGYHHKEYDAILKQMACVGSGALMTLVSVMGTIAYAPVGMFGTDDQKTKFLGKQAAFALTEPDSGSDAIGSMKTIAEENPDGTFKINGEKIFITNTHKAEILYLGAKVKQVDSSGGKTKYLPTVFIVELDPPFSLADTVEERDRKIDELAKKGIKISQPLKLNTICGSNQAHITITDLTVPKENILGNVGDGPKILFGSLNKGRAAFASSAAQASLEQLGKARYWTQVRKLNMFKMFDPNEGGRLGMHPFVQNVMGHAIAEAQGSYAVSELTASLFNELGDDLNLRAESAIVKAEASDTLEDISRIMHRLHGGVGYMEGHLAGVPTSVTDAQIMGTVEGQNDLMRQFGAGVALNGIKTDGETVLGHLKGYCQRLLSFGIFKIKKPIPTDFAGKLLPAVGRTVSGLLGFQRGPLTYKEAISLQWRAKKLALKITALGIKNGEKLVKMPVELSRIGSAIYGIYAITAVQIKLAKDKDKMSEPVIKALERFIEIKYKQVDKDLADIRVFGCKDDAKNQDLAKVWMESDLDKVKMQELGPYSIDLGHGSRTTPYNY